MFRVGGGRCPGRDGGGGVGMCPSMCTRASNKQGDGTRLERRPGGRRAGDPRASRCGGPAGSARTTQRAPAAAAPAPAAVTNPATSPLREATPAWSCESCQHRRRDTVRLSIYITRVYPRDTVLARRAGLLAMALCPCLS